MTASRDIDFELSGLRCGGCASGLARKLKSHAGLADISVNYGTMRLTASVLNRDISDVDIDEWVRDAGYALRYQHYDLTVEGMRCGGCAAGLKRKLAGIEGAQNITVNYAGGSVHVEARNDIGEMIKQVIAQAGYHLVTSDDQKNTAPPSPFHQEVLFALAASIYFMWPMVFMAFGDHTWHHHWAYNGWFQACLAGLVQFSIGRDFIIGAYRCMRSGIWTMDLLVFTGTTAAFGLSLWNLTAQNSPDLYFEASVVIITFLMIGKALEEQARSSAFNALNALQELLPDWVMIERAGEFVRAPFADVKKGDRLKLRQGDRVPADGVITEGAGSFDESILTGESMPVAKNKGMDVRAGTMTSEGALIVEVTAVGRSARLGQIADLIKKAQNGDHPYQRLADKISGIFVPIVFVLSALTLIGWWIFHDDWSSGLIPAISVLVIACPCALGLAAPITIMNGLLAASRSGILVRDFASMERASLVDTVLFDKTGTITKGEAVVVGEEWYDGQGPDPSATKRVLHHLSQQSSHPLAMSLSQYLDAKHSISGQIQGISSPVTSKAGQGVSCDWQDLEWKLGRYDFVTDQSNETTDDQYSRIYFGVDNRVIAAFLMEDYLRDDTQFLLNRINEMGLKTGILSGDRISVVQKTAHALGVSDWHGAMTPDGKMDKVDAYQASGRKVLMVGDGVNDGPALAHAFIGLSVSKGSDLAKGAADVTIFNEGLKPILDFLDIAKRTRSKIKQNLGWAFLYNIIGIPIAMSGHLDPAFAGLAMTLSSLSVVGNASLLYVWKGQG